MPDKMFNPIDNRDMIQFLCDLEENSRQSFRLIEGNLPDNTEDYDDLRATWDYIVSFTRYVRRQWEQVSQSNCDELVLMHENCLMKAVYHFIQDGQAALTDSKNHNTAIDEWSTLWTSCFSKGIATIKKFILSEIQSERLG